MRPNKEPEYQDVVKSKIAGDIVGTVIAKYPIDVYPYQDHLVVVTKKTISLLDVRVGDRIYWATPAENWEVVRAYKEEEIV